MSNFKTIEKLGIDLLYAYQCDRKVTVIYAEDLESLLQSAQVVYGNRGRDGSWNESAWDNDTHTAILLGITPLKKKTKTEEALEFVESLAKDKTKFWNVATLEEAKQISEMKDEE